MTKKKDIPDKQAKAFIKLGSMAVPMIIAIGLVEVYRGTLIDRIAHQIFGIIEFWLLFLLVMILVCLGLKYLEWRRAGLVKRG